MFKKHLNYFKDNPKQLWFKRKLYGWGWVPVRWQGWLVLVLYVGLVVLFALTVDEQSSPREIMFTGVLPIVLLTVTLIRICYATGEKPKWQWGLPKDSKE